MSKFAFAFCDCDKILSKLYLNQKVDKERILLTNLSDHLTERIKTPVASILLPLIRCDKKKCNYLFFKDG